MKIWDKLIFSGTAIASVGSIITGIYFCTIEHVPAASIGFLVGGGAFFALSCAKLLDKKNAYVQCSYHEEEEDINLSQAANQLIAYQQENVRHKEDDNHLLDMVEMKRCDLQLVEGPFSPKANPKNPYITNDIFRDDIDIEELQKEM